VLTSDRILLARRPGHNDLGRLGDDMTWTVEPGTLVVPIAAQSRDIHLREEFVVR